MNNHYHVVITTHDANLSDAMRDINGDYAQWWNKRHGRVGHVFQARFDSQIVQDGVYFLTVCRYAVLNPVRARIVTTPQRWPWSSYRATCGMCPRPDFLSTDLLLGQFADASGGPVEGYRQFVAAASVRQKLPCGPVIGDKAFRAQFKQPADKASPEVPRRGRDVEQLTLRQLLAGDGTPSERDARIAAAHQRGFHMAEIARTLGIHYTTVSKILKRHSVAQKVMIQDLTPSRSAADAPEVIVGAEEQAAAGDRRRRDDALADGVLRHDLRLRAALHHERDAPLAGVEDVTGAGDG